jgi:hypothetical protein
LSNIFAWFVESLNNCSALRTPYCFHKDLCILYLPCHFQSKIED